MNKFKVGDVVYIDGLTRGVVKEVDKADHTYGVEFSLGFNSGGYLFFEEKELSYPTYAITCNMAGSTMCLAYNEANDGYFWTDEKTYFELKRNSTTKHPFIFNSKRNGVKHLRTLKIKQKCKVIEVYGE